MGLLVILLFFASCEDFLNIDAPVTELISEDVFEDDLTATAAMAGLYASMSTGSGGLNSITFLGGLLADESILFSTDQNTQQFYTNNIIPSNGKVSTFWGSSGYTYIYQANSVIEGLDGSSQVTPSLKTQLTGEALFIRAFLHFYLLNLFGDIPYITTTNYISNTSAVRLPKTEVFQNIISDLLDAQGRLPDDYSFSDSERIRPIKWAATSLLARVYLYSGAWELAEAQSTSVIDNIAMFNLTSLDEVYLKNSNESIWQLKPDGSNENTQEGTIFILTGTPRYSALTDEFINSFEPGDLRKQHWIDSIIVGENTWSYPFKYKIRTGSDPFNEYSMVLRLAEQYLIRAEARCMQHKLTSAIDDIDVIRQRSGLPLINTTNPSISKEDLELLIERERRAELFSEWGHRWLDLKRTGRADVVLSAVKSGWQSTDALFPIPASDILVNRNMTQNPGY